MKIFGGKLKGRNFYMPAGIRPTQGMTREAIFDLLGHDLSGISFLDLYAGSGGVGLEALSRGAGKVTFIEKDQKCLETIQENVQLLNPDQALGETLVMGMDALTAIKRLAGLNQKFDIIFFDPPYDKGLVKKTLKTLGAYDILAAVSFVLVEHTDKERTPDQEEGLTLIKNRRYGKSFLALYQREPIPQGD